jgi:hypothetical protein
MLELHEQLERWVRPASMRPAHWEKEPLVQFEILVRSLQLEHWEQTDLKRVHLALSELTKLEKQHQAQLGHCRQPEPMLLFHGE